jgi:hypothetical protein
MLVTWVQQNFADPKSKVIFSLSQHDSMCSRLQFSTFHLLACFITSCISDKDIDNKQLPRNVTRPTPKMYIKRESNHKKMTKNLQSRKKLPISRFGDASRGTCVIPDGHLYSERHHKKIIIKY